MAKNALPVSLYRHTFRTRRGQLYCENVPVEGIAEKVGTPVYIYSKKTILEHYRKLRSALAWLNPLICFSVKSNSNLAVLKTLARAGSGFDVVSGGELFRVLKVGADPRKIVFASVGKTDTEIQEALRRRILLFNVESLAELSRIEYWARRMRRPARAALRLNPEIEPHTHHYISTGRSESKFGIHFETARQIFHEREKFPHVSLEGVHIHIGSQIESSKPFIEAIRKVLAFIDELRRRGITIRWLNIGGGLGIVYSRERVQTAQEYAKRIIPLLKGKKLHLILEPGRFISGNSGILVTKLLYVKPQGRKRFLIVDAGMNDLIRPSLYSAYHEIEPVQRTRGPKWPDCDIVGPVCESGDFLAKNRPFPRVKEGSLLAVYGAGAYGFVMASNYNSRPRPAEVLVSGTRFAVVRARESQKDLICGERIPKWV